MHKNMHALPDGITLAVASREQARAIKALDDLAFGGQQGISLEEIFDIIDNGTILLLMKGDVILGESQLLMHRTSFLHMDIPSDAIFVYGTAVHPSEQGSGLVASLMYGQEMEARRLGRPVLQSTCRAENYPILKTRLTTGSRATKYLPDFYGPVEQNGARFLLEKNLDADVPQAIECARVPIQFGEHPDMEAHKQIAHLFSQGCHVFAVDGSHNVAGELLFCS